jgi:hypothetical protein
MVNLNFFYKKFKKIRLISAHRGYCENQKKEKNEEYDYGYPYPSSSLRVSRSKRLHIRTKGLHMSMSRCKRQRVRNWIYDDRTRVIRDGHWSIIERRSVWGSRMWVRHYEILKFDKDVL